MDKKYMSTQELEAIKEVAEILKAERGVVMGFGYGFESEINKKNIVTGNSLKALKDIEEASKNGYLSDWEENESE